MKEYCMLHGGEWVENIEGLRLEPGEFLSVEKSAYDKLEEDLKAYKKTLYTTAKGEEAWKNHANTLAHGLEKVLAYVSYEVTEQHRRSAVVMITNYLANHKKFTGEAT